MKHRPDTPEGVEEIRQMLNGERILWLRISPQRKRDLMIYPETLRPEQRQRLEAIEQELLEMAHEATPPLTHGMPGRIALNELRHKTLLAEGCGRGEAGDASTDDQGSFNIGHLFR